MPAFVSTRPIFNSFGSLLTICRRQPSLGRGEASDAWTLALRFEGTPRSAHRTVT